MERIPTVTVPMQTLAEVIEMQLQAGGKASLTVTGSSMMPMLRHRRDSVVLVPPRQKQEKGDVILYRRENGQYVLHRIIKITEECYICSGDNQYDREKVIHDQVIATVVGFVRKGKRYSCEQAGYRLYTWLWVELFFLREGYIALRRPLGRLYGRLTRNWGRKFHRQSREDKK